MNPQAIQNLPRSQTAFGRSIKSTTSTPSTVSPTALLVTITKSPTGYRARCLHHGRAHHGFSPDSAKSAALRCGLEIFGPQAMLSLRATHAPNRQQTYELRQTI